MQQDNLSCGKCFPNTIRLLDHFHDLQTTLQTEFSLLKKATLKNIENLQEAINLQQNYTTALCGHVNSIYAKLAQLNRQVQTHCLYLHPQLDVIYYQIYNHPQHCTLPTLRMSQHMPKHPRRHCPSHCQFPRTYSLFASFR